VVCGTPTDNSRPDQHSPLDRLTLTQREEKREKNKLDNKQAAEKKKKRQVAKRTERPEPQSVGEGKSLLEL
jgi:hypothetical protein